MSIENVAVIMEAGRSHIDTTVRAQGRRGWVVCSIVEKRPGQRAFVETDLVKGTDSGTFRLPADGLPVGTILRVKSMHSNAHGDMRTDYSGALLITGQEEDGSYSVDEFYNPSTAMAGREQALRAANRKAGAVAAVAFWQRVAAAQPQQGAA